MAERFEITVNHAVHSVDSESDSPLLYVLTNDLRLKGPRFGCGLAQCGSCSVLLDGMEVRARVTPIAAVQGRAVTTLEGLPRWYAEQRRLTEVPDLHPMQQAVIDEQAIQCGYCFNGMIVKAAELLANNPEPSTEQIKAAMNGHLCRCGMYPRIVKAVQSAARKIAEATA
jgi:aerobic-type carbon monoxide dehydrogenase small subunit (CoxS/CutS family)